MEKKKIVCMGDSITEGFMVEREENYPFKLGRILGENYEVLNMGQCSTCVLNVESGEGLMGIPYVRQPLYQEALSERADMYILMFGTNDAQDGMDDIEDIRYPLFDMISKKAHFKEHYRAMIKEIRRANANAQIGLCLPIPIQKCIWRKHREEYLKDLREYMKELAKEEGLLLIDVYAAFAKLPAEKQVSLYREDGLHPNEEGYTRIAETVAESILTSLAFCALIN